MGVCPIVDTLEVWCGFSNKALLARFRAYLLRGRAVSMGQRNTCSTRLLAGVLRAKVGREARFKKILLCIGLMNTARQIADQLSGRCCIDRVSWRLLSECSFLYLRWWFMLQRYAAKESLRNFWRALSLPRMNFPVGRLLGHGQNGERTRHHRAASNASV